MRIERSWKNFGLGREDKWLIPPDTLGGKFAVARNEQNSKYLTG